jgi:hypothetical protein
MKKIFLLILFFISSCSQIDPKTTFNFSNDMSLKEFKIMLKEYAKQSPFPNIDN